MATAEAGAVVRDLKQELRRLHNIPVGMQQLVQGDCCLDDRAELHDACDLQLVLLPVSSAWSSAEKLFRAISRNDVETALMLCHGGALRLDSRNCSPERLNTALVAASNHGSMYIVQRLLEARACTEFKNKRGNTALMCACANGSMEVSRVLLEFGANTNLRRNSDGNTALMDACDNGHVEMVHMLLDARANVDLRNHSGKTPLMCALQEGHTEIAQALLRTMGKAKLTDTDAVNTALICACDNGYSESARLRLVKTIAAKQP